MKLLNRTGHSMDPQGTPLITALHLDTELLNITLWMQPSRQFFIHHGPPIKSFSLQFGEKDVGRDHVECPTEVQMNDIRSPSLSKGRKERHL